VAVEEGGLGAFSSETAAEVVLLGLARGLEVGVVADVPARASPLVDEGGLLLEESAGEVLFVSAVLVGGHLEVAPDSLEVVEHQLLLAFDFEVIGPNFVVDVLVPFCEVFELWFVRRVLSVSWPRVSS
jgi:hypothetical protein